MAATILVVEDDPAVSLALEVALKGEGYTALLAATGDKGLEIGLAQAPDLLILDVRLPGIDGFELLRRSRHETKRWIRSSGLSSARMTT